MTDLPVAIRPFRADDVSAMLHFAQALPEHDLMFLGRDLRHAKVVDAWIAATAEGAIDSLVAEDGGAVCATAALVRDPLGWSPHVGEVRLLVAPALRGQGVGRALLQQIFRTAIERDCAKLIARMTPDQTNAIALFESMGFRGEALLRDHLRDRRGAYHDLAILSADVARIAAQHEAFGLT